MWDFVVLKHGHESSQGVGPTYFYDIYQDKYASENFESSSICKNIVKCCEVILFFNHVGAYFKMNVAP